MKLRALFYTLALLLLATVARAENVRLDLAASNTWWGQVPLMVAIDKGYFREQGIDTELKNIGPSGDRIAALTAGSVAFSNLGRIAAIVEMARGNKSFYYFANIDDSPGNEGCWARPGYNSFRDLRGKKVAANTSAQITMNGLLENEGMRERDIQFVNLPGPEMAAALAKGDVDAACVWEPLLTAVKAGTPGGKLLGLDSDTPNFKKFGTMASPDVMIISSKLVDEQPDLARKLTAAIFKGVAETNAHPKESAELVAHYFRKPPDEVLAAMHQFKYFGAENWPEHMRLHSGQMQYLAQWLYDNGKIPSLPDTSKWENVSFIPKP
ncbi:MAG TPA: ABC transporter substrate-binding protein [Acetobacteraceae bacterium]|jgi:NitT/TauT family transport system substrate-binding protein|nr:ABC transporter substrate-binding protein [Acetobacteraceae bacterium]